LASRTAPEAILSVLKRGPKRGLTAALIAERTGFNLSTTRTTLYSLASSGDVSVIGTTETGSRGRPANLYALAA
jgi:DNA-binding IclR family transcriptional regulator